MQFYFNLILDQCRSFIVDPNESCTAQCSSCIIGRTCTTQCDHSSQAGLVQLSAIVHHIYIGRTCTAQCVSCILGRTLTTLCDRASQAGLVKLSAYWHPMQDLYSYVRIVHPRRDLYSLVRSCIQGRTLTTQCVLASQAGLLTASALQIQILSPSIAHMQIALKLSFVLTAVGLWRRDSCCASEHRNVYDENKSLSISSNVCLINTSAII